MVEMASPLAQKLQPGTFGAQGLGGVTLGTRTLGNLSQLAGWDDFETAVQHVLKAAGLTGLGDYLRAQRVEGVTAWRTAPDKVLIEGADDLTGKATANLVAVDLSHARTVITLEGAGARDVLSMVIELDTREGSLPEGNYLQTVIQQVGVLIQCTGPESFEIFVPSTWSETLWDFIYVNALSVGVTVKGGS